MRDLITDGYQYFDITVHYSSYVDKVDALDISIMIDGHYCFYDDTMLDEIFHLELKK